MPTRTIALTATEQAFVAIVLEEHGAMLRLADRKRDERLQVVRTEKGVPDGTLMTVEQKNGVLSLSYEAPDIPASPEAPSPPAAGEDLRNQPAPSARI